MNIRHSTLRIIACGVAAASVSAQDPCGAWGVIPTPNAPTSTNTILHEVSIVAPNDVWAVGGAYVTVTGGSEMHTIALHWDGASWTIVPSPSPSPYPGGGWADFQSVHAVSPNDVWAAGGQRIQAPDGFTGTHLMVQHWNGSSWQIIPAPVTVGGSGNFIDDIEVISANDIWFVGDWLEFPPTSSAEKRALAMHWNGSSFAIFNTPFFDNNPIGGHGLTAVHGLASNDIWAVGGGHDGDYVGFSYIVHWDGSQWSYRPGPTVGFAQRLFDVQMFASNEVYAVGEYEDASGYHGLFLRWNGSTWTRLPDPPVGGSTIEVFSPTQIYVGGNGVARWDGATWTTVATFTGVNSTSVQSLEPVGPCALWGSGRQLAGTAIEPLTVRLDPGFVGTAYCTAGTSTTGCVPTLSVSGNPSASSSSGFTISASHVNGQRLGLFFYGINGRAAVPWASGSTSFLCVKTPTQRMTAQTTGGTLGGCDGALNEDWLAYVAAHSSALGSPFSAGAVVDAQAWYRDPPAPKTTNLSGGIEFTMAP